MDREQFVSYIKRFTLYDNIISSVMIVNDLRMVSTSRLDVTDSRDKITFFEMATLIGFDNGRFADISELIFDGKNLLNTDVPIKMVAFDKAPDIDNLITIYDEQHQYLAQKYGNNILLSTNIDFLPENIIDIILTKFNFKKMDNEEYITKMLIDFSKTSNITNVEKIRSEIDFFVHRKNEAMSSYIENHKRKVDLEFKLNGYINSEENRWKEINNSYNRLLKGDNIESIEIRGDQIIVLTKPLMIEIWNIGQYRISYRLKSYEPIIKRVSPPVAYDYEYVTADGRHVKPIDEDHPHITNGMLCTGNFGDTLRMFWDTDMLTGVNLAIQFLKSYDIDGGPFIDFNSWLLHFGYLDDVITMKENKIQVSRIDNGRVFIVKDGRTTELTKDMIEEIGLSGNIETNPERYNEYLINTSVASGLGIDKLVEIINIEDLYE